MPRKRPDYTPLEGFPIREPFTSMAEVDAYLSGNLIQCRECGHHFAALPRHIACHEISADDYKQIHGIPWTRGLVSGQLHSALSEYAKSENSVAKVQSSPKRQKGTKVGARNYCLARRNEMMVYSQDTYYEFARRVANGEAVLTISKEDGMPSVHGLAHHIKKNAEFASYWEKVVKPNILPFQTKFRKNLESGKVEKAMDMAEKGHSAKEIADATGYCRENAYHFIWKKNWPSMRNTNLQTKRG